MPPKRRLCWLSQRGIHGKGVRLMMGQGGRMSIVADLARYPLPAFLECQIGQPWPIRVMPGKGKGQWPLCSPVRERTFQDRGILSYRLKKGVNVKGSAGVRRRDERIRPVPRVLGKLDFPGEFRGKYLDEQLRFLDSTIGSKCRPRSSLGVQDRGKRIY